MIDPAQEYSTLREEMLQAKRYVFERPLLIAALGAGGFGAISPEYVGGFVLALAGLIVFNFWFTVNRLMSAARIVAYIQLVLEGSPPDAWIGWESSLRYYRKWLRRNPTRAGTIVAEEMEKDAAPDAMQHYPPIYRLHVAMMAAAVLAAAVLAVRVGSGANVVSAVGVLGLGVIFARDCHRYRPAFVSSLIERNRVIWTHVFAFIQDANRSAGGDDSQARAVDPMEWKFR